MKHVNVDIKTSRLSSKPYAILDDRYINKGKQVFELGL